MQLAYASLAEVLLENEPSMPDDEEAVHLGVPASTELGAQPFQPSGIEPHLGGASDRPFPVDRPIIDRWGEGGMRFAPRSSDPDKQGK
jgi:hypothetical protein